MPDLSQKLTAINKWLQRDIHANCGCGNCELMQELKKEKMKIEKLLKQKNKFN